jgi:putative cofactor-binding repeat protein
VAKASGGGVYINFDSFDLQNSTISGNTANTSGGGGITKNNGALMQNR